MTDWNSYRNYIVSWVEEKKTFIVHFEDDPKKDSDYIDPIYEKIVIDGTQEYEVQTYRLLHECGHIMIWENGTKFGFEEKSGRCVSDSFREKTYTVIEEYVAWERALSLAKRLGIPIDMVKWEEEMMRAISEYVKWAAK